MPRGFFSIGLQQPKTNVNVSQVMRICSCYDASMLAITGERYKRTAADTTGGHKHRPLLQVNNLRDALPYQAVPVAVDLVEDAEDLTTFEHPESAYYIFGPEDGTLDSNVLQWCRKRVKIPTNYCLNLAVSVATVMYDRVAKQNRKLN